MFSNLVAFPAWHQEEVHDTSAYLATIVFSVGCDFNVSLFPKPLQFCLYLFCLSVMKRSVWDLGGIFICYLSFQKLDYAKLDLTHVHVQVMGKIRNEIHK